MGNTDETEEIIKKYHNIVVILIPTVKSNDDLCKFEFKLTNNEVVNKLSEKIKQILIQNNKSDNVSFIVMNIHIKYDNRLLVFDNVFM